ncbi:MAG: MBL fold metallo-hydrolase [Bacilli bacterium]|nr:MBL fold metallo-hydrolase [Bacilli bacterium]
MLCQSTKMKFKSLASGSKGNCSIVICQDTKIIIDIGISYLSLKRKLESSDIDISEFSILLITHSHSDHIKGLESFIKRTHIKIGITKEMYQEFKEIIPLNRILFLQDANILNDVNITLIHTSHDTSASYGYIISYNNKSLVYVTDTGYINRKYLNMMKEKDIYLIESNHDEEMLMNGKYPQFLKQRVLSDKGHLSNKTTAGYLEKIVGDNTKYVLLAHLSHENNTEEKALIETKEKLYNKNINILIARQDEESPLIEV